MSKTTALSFLFSNISKKNMEMHYEDVEKKEGVQLRSHLSVVSLDL